MDLRPEFVDFVSKNRPGGPDRDLSGTMRKATHRLTSDRTVDRVATTKREHEDLVTLGQSNEPGALLTAARRLQCRPPAESWVARFQANTLSAAMGAFNAGPVSMAVQKVVEGEFMAGPLYLVDEASTPAIREHSPIGWGCVDLKANLGFAQPLQPPEPPTS